MKHIKVERKNGTSIITLNRPDTFNALGIPLAEEFSRAIIDEGSDDEVSVIVITGEGKAFSGGGDIKGMKEYLDGDPLLFFKRLVLFLDAAILDITRLEKPVLCAVNGIAAGAGLALALSCDMLFASEKASFDAAFHRVGLVPDGGFSFLVPRTIGYHRAMELIYADRKLTAQEALEWGLINRVVPHDELMPTVLEFAERLKEGPLSGFGTTKRLFLDGMQNSLETQLEAERQAIAARGRTSDFRKAVQRFLDRVSKK